MGTTLALVTGLILSLAAFLIWRGARRVSTFSSLKNVTVSRQWLMEHQGDDRS